METESIAPRLALVVRVWFGASLLGEVTVSPPRPLALARGQGGVRLEEGPPLVLLVGHDALALAPEPLVVASGEHGLALAPDSAGDPAASRDALAEDEPTSCERAGLRLDLVLERVAVTPPRAPFFSRRVKRVAAASALAHVVALGAFALLHRPTTPEERVARAQLALFRIQLADDEAREARLAAEGGADAREGGTGARAKGEEGRMGVASDPRLARAAAMREAAEFGMIGLLSVGAGGDPAAPAAGVGTAYGAGGLGLSGVGQGGGGLGLGTVGTLGHGAGTGTGQGFGSGHGRLGGSHKAGPSHGNVWGAGLGPSYVPSQGPSPGPSPGPVAEPRVDPNGRFATTYRPGRGHLAAFDAAVARGSLTAADRGLVADVGAPRAKAVEQPNGRSLGMAVDHERALLPPSGGRFHVRLSLASTGAHALRPKLSVSLVVDTSGSMSGHNITQARAAAKALIDQLAPSDELAIVAFSSEARVVLPVGPIGPRRSAAKRVVDGLEADGGTNLGGGLALGYQELGKTARDGVRVALVLSDGQATNGITDRDTLGAMSLEAFQSNIQTSALGVGTSYDGALMSRLAADGAGGYYYLPDPASIAPALAAELEQRLDPAATAVEVRFRVKGDVVVRKIYGSERLDERRAAAVRAQEVAADQQAKARRGIQADRADDRHGGMRFFMPQFARADRHAMLFELEVGPGTTARDVGVVELRYKDLVHGKNVTEELPVRVSFGVSDAESGKSQDPDVLRAVQVFKAGESLTEAVTLLGRGHDEAAGRLLHERERIVRHAGVMLFDPALASEAERLARLRGRLGSMHGGDRLALSMLLGTAASARLR
jgi:Ca-activated chloride channel family protein